MKEFFDGSVTFVAIDGLTEVGSKNCLAVIRNGKVIIFDVGMAIPANGEDLSPYVHFPDLKFIFKHNLEVEAIVLSHGHMDHAAALAWIYNRLVAKKQRPRIIGSRHTIKVAEMYYASQAGEEGLYFAVNPFDNAEIVALDSTVRVADATLDFFSVPHSIPGSLGFVLRWGGKSIMYPGDINPRGFSEKEEKKLYRDIEALRPIDVVLLDATGIEREAHSSYGVEAIEESLKIIRSAPGIVVCSTFSSNVDRIAALIEGSKELGRPIVVSGKSLYRHLEFAGVHSGRDYMSYSFPFENEIPDNAVIFMTGSNGEEMSAMERMMRGAIDGLYPDSNYTILLPTSTIPNEEAEGQVTDLLHELSRTGCNIHVSPHVYVDPSLNGGINVDPCHVSGHGYRNDLIEVVNRAEPNEVIGVHGDRSRRETLAHVVSPLVKEAPVPDNLRPVVLS